MEPEIVLRTEQLQKTFGSVQVIQDVSLAVQRGEIYGFLGPNGAGKTTTIGMLLGLIHPTAGTVTLFGQLVTPLAIEALQQVGALVGANPALVPYLTARQHLWMIHQLHKGVAIGQIDEVLELVGLSQAANRRVDRFSTGMKQRLGLAMALLHQPELLILDEPTNGMDPAGMREIRNFLRRLADQGTTVFISSHLLHEMEQICDRVAVLHKGRIVAEGPVRMLHNASEVVRVRVKDPQAAMKALPAQCHIQQNGAYLDISGMSSEQVIVTLVQQGVVPSEVMIEQADLEALFLALTDAAASPPQ